MTNSQFYNKEAENGGGSVEGIGKRKAYGGGFLDLDVYRSSYQAMIKIFKIVLPALPKEERFDLFDQLRRSAKAVPRLIAEGHSKRHQNKGFQKYIDDAHAESNETIVSLSQFRDIYAKGSIVEECNILLDQYDKISRQLFNLARSWDKYNKSKLSRRLPPPDVSHDATD